MLTAPNICFDRLRYAIIYPRYEQHRWETFEKTSFHLIDRFKPGRLILQKTKILSKADEDMLNNSTSAHSSA